MTVIQRLKFMTVFVNKATAMFDISSKKIYDEANVTW